MKIGLIGNMNNNNFALLRHLLDLGADAELLLMADDGIGAMAHFSPESDTWDLSRWAARIRQLDAPNRFISAIGSEFPWNLMFWAKHMLSVARGNPHPKLTRPLSASRLDRTLRPYDRLVGSGIAPALLMSAGRRLDVFYPYSSGVEWVGDPDVTALMKGQDRLKRAGALRVRDKQIAGIRASRHVVSSDIGYTAQVFAEMGISPLLMQLPMLYKEASPATYPPQLSALLDQLSHYDLRFISHARHRWCNTGDFQDDEWEFRYSKHNNWIIHAFAQFQRQRPHVRSVLVLLDYGTDATNSRLLCQELGISESVLWIERMPRMQLLEVINACDVGIGEFYSMPRMIWGGTALEIMACAKPLVQGFVFDDGEFQSLYGSAPPPMCAVRTQEDLTRWLLQLGDSPLLRSRLGEEGLRWFDSYNGRGLARQWLDLIAA